MIETESGWPRDPNTRKGNGESLKMFRAEGKYLGGSMTSSFEIVLRVLTERAKMKLKMKSFSCQ